MEKQKKSEILHEENLFNKISETSRKNSKLNEKTRKA
jgi:hypothetical protein